MYSLVASSDESVLEGGRRYWTIRRRYWSIQDYLPVDGTKIQVDFRLQNREARFFAQYDSEEQLHILIECGGLFSSLLSVRAGIVDETKTRVFLSKIADRKLHPRSTFEIQGLFSRSEVDHITNTNGISYLFIEIVMEDDLNAEKKYARKRKRQADFKELLLSGKNSDVTLKVRRKTFNCHRCILGIRSSVFSSIMDQGTSKQENGVMIIKDAKPAVFQDFMQFLYTGNEDLVTTENVADMYKLADKYNMEELKNLCGEFMQANRSLENVCDRKLEMDFKELLLTGKESDVTLKVSRRKFNCHRCILAARSSVFSAMMEQDMANKKSGLVTIKDAKPTVFEEFLSYIYTGNEDIINFSNVADMYVLGHQYKMEDIINLTTEFIKENISTENFFEFFKLSEKFSDSELCENIVEFFVENAEEILHSEEWLVLLTENPLQCNKLFKAHLKSKTKI